MPWLARIVLAAVVLGGCARTTEAVGGETNWLKCESDTQCSVCVSGPCPMQGMGIAAIDGDRAVVLADDERGSTVPGIPSVALLDETRALEPFVALPSVVGSATAIAAGTYIAVLGQSPSQSPSLFEWRDGTLESMGGHDEIRDIAAADTDVIVAGNLLQTDAGSAWLARVDTGGAERWRIGSPSDPAAAAGEQSIAIASDASDGSLRWLLGRNDGADWFALVARVDRDGKHVWSTRLRDAADEWSTDRDDWLVNPGVAANDGVTSVAGAVNTRGGPLDPELRLSFRQLDDGGVELRRWDGLDTDVNPNATPVVADDQGNVYVAWTIGTLGQLRMVILRFAPTGDPCLLADVPDQFPVDIVLASGAVWFVTVQALGRVAP